MFKILATHVAIAVPDLDETMKYLEESLGMEKLRQVTRPTFKVAWYPGLELRQSNDSDPAGMVNHLAWQVDDIDQAVHELSEKGVCFESEQPKMIDVNVVSTREVVRFIFFRTPSGYQGELYQVSPPEAI